MGWLGIWGYFFGLVRFGFFLLENDTDGSSGSLCSSSICCLPAALSDDLAQNEQDFLFPVVCLFVCFISEDHVSLAK